MVGVAVEGVRGKIDIVDKFFCQFGIGRKGRRSKYKEELRSVQTLVFRGPRKR